MLNASNVPEAYVTPVKRHLRITWSDADTDARIVDLMLDAEIALNHKLGAEVDYFVPSQERGLYLAYLLYAWNDCLNEFDAAYRAEILQLRHKHAIAGLEAQENDP